MAQKWQPLLGAVDLHIHIGPDIVERYYDSIDLAHEAAEAGMAGFAVKDQLCPSMFKAALTRKVVPGIDVIGAIVLNEICGGLSTRAVLYALKAEAKIVWLPTVDAKYAYQKGLAGHWIKRVSDRNAFGGANPEYMIIDHSGECIPVVREILALAAQYGAVVASGHVSPEECLALLRANKNIGTNIVITHPNLWFDDFTIPILHEMVELGAILEFTMGGLSPNRGHGDLYQMANTIKSVGHQHCILATDSGAIDSPPPPEDLRTFCYLLRSAGISEKEVDFMVRDNPRKLMGMGKYSGEQKGGYEQPIMCRCFGKITISKEGYL